jgi:hypothetical protein
MDTQRRDEIRELAHLTAHLSCAQQTFFQAEYGRHRRNPTTALVLCALLGGFGAHEFYFGRHRSGLLRLLFCWTLIPAVMALFDLREVAGRARHFNAILGQRIALASDESQAEILRAPVAESEQQADYYSASEREARRQRLSDELAAAFTLDRLRQATRPGPLSGPTPPMDVQVASDDDLRLAATTAPIWDTDLAEEDESEQAEAVDPSIVPVLSYSTGVARRDSVRFGPPSPAETVLVPVPVDEPIAESVVPAFDTVTAQSGVHHIQRIIVRKLAFQDGHVAAEAIAEREVELGLGDDEARVRRATDEARHEALRQLALTTSGEIAQAAWSVLREQHADIETGAPM